ncbi:Cap15 family cyclic dinucleotide receptor domain-containing protein [Roseobacteraceae bacterium S113]
MPNLNGSWPGEINSDWVDPQTRRTISAIQTHLAIKQSLFNISCVARTNEMTSYSISAGVERSLNDHVIRLVYTYRSEPRPGVSDRSQIHHGTSILEFSKKPTWQLKGRYFTERSTTGEINLTFDCRDHDAPYDDKIKAHPMQRSAD